MLCIYKISLWRFKINSLEINIQVVAHSYYRPYCVLSIERCSSPCKLHAMQCPWALKHSNAYSFLCTSLTKKGISFDFSQLPAYFWRAKLSQMNFCCPVIFSVNGFFSVMLLRTTVFILEIISASKVPSLLENYSDQSRTAGRRSKDVATQNTLWVLKGQNEGPLRFSPEH